jgi:hypothetical protein
MCGDAEELKTARHEAAHAVAALHYDCGLEFASIERGPGTLGSTRIGVSRIYHVIPLFCGPLAERAWHDFDVQPHHPRITLYGGDRDQFEYLRCGFQGDLNSLQREAWWFLGQKEVQEQIDRVAQALLERKRLSLDQIVEIAGFAKRLCSSDWFDGGDTTN